MRMFSFIILFFFSTSSHGITLVCETDHDGEQIAFTLASTDAKPDISSIYLRHLGNKGNVISQVLLSSANVVAGIKIEKEKLCSTSELYGYYKIYRRHISCRRKPQFILDVSALYEEFELSASLKEGHYFSSWGGGGLPNYSFSNCKEE